MSTVETAVRSQPRARKVTAAETDHDKFRRLVTQRVRQLKKYARLVKNCASYEFTSDEKEKIIAEVFRIAHEIKSAFENAGKDRAKRDEFSL